MAKDPLEKRIEWLDEERRKDKGVIKDLEKRIAKLESLLEKSNTSIKEISSEVTTVGVKVDRMDDLDAAIQTHREEVKKELDAQDSRAKRREQEFKKKFTDQVGDIKEDVADIHKNIDEAVKLREDVLAQKDENNRFNQKIAEVDEKIRQYADEQAERSQLFRSLEEDRRQDLRRMTDIQGELAALRKRADEARAKVDLVSENQKKIDTRINEVMAAEVLRRDNQNEFVDKANQLQDQLQREWKQRTKDLDGFSEQVAKVENYLRTLDEAERAMNKAQQSFDNITDQISRRINEITEMQRLGEERFRQEWATFKSDDQKRWTNYTLTQEEHQRELNRRTERLVDQSAALEDNLQELQDVVTHLSEQTEKMVQGLLANFRDWLTENERFVDSIR